MGGSYGRRSIKQEIGRRHQKSRARQEKRLRVKKKLERGGGAGYEPAKSKVGRQRRVYIGRRQRT